MSVRLTITVLIYLTFTTNSMYTMQAAIIYEDRHDKDLHTEHVYLYRKKYLSQQLEQIGHARATYVPHEYAILCELIISDAAGVPLATDLLERISTILENAHNVKHITRTIEFKNDSHEAILECFHFYKEAKYLPKAKKSLEAELATGSATVVLRRLNKNHQQ